MGMSDIRSRSDSDAGCSIRTPSPYQAVGRQTFISSRASSSRGFISGEVNRASLVPKGKVPPGPKKKDIQPLWERKTPSPEALSLIPLSALRKKDDEDVNSFEVVSICKTPKDAYMGMAEKGAEVCEKGALKVFHQAFYAGCYIGFGGQLSMNIAGGIAHMAKDDPGLQTFVFAALFPVNLLIILLTGGVLITGVSAIVPAAVLEGKAHWSNIPKYFAISWIGNLLGSLVFAYCIQYIDLNLDVADICLT